MELPGTIRLTQTGTKTAFALQTFTECTLCIRPGTKYHVDKLIPKVVIRGGFCIYRKEGSETSKVREENKSCLAILAGVYLRVHES